MASEANKIRILIAARDRAVRDQLRQYIMSYGDTEIVATATDGQEAVQLTVLLRPDAVMICSDLPIHDGFKVAQMIGSAAPEVARVLLADKAVDADYCSRSMSSGISACLTYPLSESELRGVVRGLRELREMHSSTEYQIATNPSLLPKVIAVTGGKGGIGKTTISAIMSMYLAEKNAGRVVLCDLYTQYGDVATILGIAPTHTICDLIQSDESLDIESLQGCMVDYFNGLKVLVAANRSKQIDAIGVSEAENVILSLKRAYTHIVIDLPPILQPTTLYVLSQAYHSIIMTNLFDIPTLRDTKELYDAIVGTYVSADRVSIVANRASKSDRLRVDDAEKLFGRKISVQIPNDRRLVSSMNQGIPFMQRYSRSPILGAIAKLVERIESSGVIDQD